MEKRLAKPKSEEEKKKANERHSLKRFVRLVNENFCAGGLYVTLTYNDKNLPTEYNEAEKNLRKYIRCLKYKFPEAKIIGVTGYGDGSGRLHHHLIISGVWEKVAVDKWKKGSITRIEPLRSHNVYNGVDCGRDYTALATYLWRHGKGKEKGKRWIQTKTLVQPEAEEAREIKRFYGMDKHPRTPKGYKMVDCYEGKGGYLYFKYVKEITYKRNNDY
jgi:hypothetical protein